MGDARSAPALPAHFLLGHLPRRQRDPLGMYLEAAETLGGFTRFQMLGKALFLVSEPEGIQRVLVDNAANYAKGFGYAAMKSVMGEGLVTAEGAAWKEQRRRCVPAFHGRRLEELLAPMREVIDAGVASWGDKGDVVDLFSASLALSRRVAARALLSVDGPLDALDDAIPVLQREVSRRSLALFSFPLPFRTPRDRAFDRALATLDEFVYSQLRSRRNQPRRNDLLQDLLDMHGPDEDAPLRDALVTLFLAAYETTATSLTWILWLLAQHPESAERIRAEIVAHPGGGPYTRQVIEEGMRLYPSVWLFARKAIEGDVVAGYQVPAGSFLLISPWVNHHLTRFWDNPAEFRPERFEAARRPAIPKHAYLPFSAGPRQCIGAAFAMMELTAMVAAVVRRHRLELPDPRHPGFEPLITLQPGRPIHLKLRAR